MKGRSCEGKRDRANGIEKGDCLKIGTFGNFDQYKIQESKFYWRMHIYHIYGNATYVYSQIYKK